ncbi:hypothetical protein GGR50DRAFT_455496 [Xylaria sp. CBS 124048]|nr:hypothetical protein GGR50DRAFT_455496 [Xylaria sp. CBS 124048]
MPNLSFFESKHEFTTDYYPEEVVEEADDSDDDEYAPSSDDQITSPSPRRPTPPSGRDRPPRSASYRLSPLDPEDFTTLALLSSPRTLTSQETASAPANLVQLGRPPCYLYSEEQHDEFYRWLHTTTWFRNFGNARRASLNVAKIWTAARRKPRPQAWKFWYEGADIETGNPKIICKRCETTYTHPRHSRKNISSSEVSEPRPARSRGRGTTTISAANDPGLDDLLSV